MLMGLKSCSAGRAAASQPRALAAPSSVGQTAVVRGRLMELLALETQPQEEADEAFVVGIFRCWTPCWACPCLQR